MLATMSRQKMTVNYPDHSFTFKQLEQMNPDIKSQTLRLRLKQALDSNKVVKSDDVVRNGNRGRAENMYSLV